MRSHRMDPARPSRRGRLTVAALLLGVGLGGLFDGIVFHQILQWHHLLSTPNPPDTVPNLELNTFADGLFHAAAWVVTLVGIWLLLFSDGERHEHGGSTILAGGLIAGWGAFNLVEGIVDHYLLQIHHVRPGPDAAVYDAAFLGWGAVFLLAGIWWMRKAAATPRREETTSSG